MKDDNELGLEILSATLPNVRRISPKYFRFTTGRINEPGLKTLQSAGMPMDLRRWLLVIDGEGINEPDYVFFLPA